MLSFSTLFIGLFSLGYSVLSCRFLFFLSSLSPRGLFLLVGLPGFVVVVGHGVQYVEYVVIFVAVVSHECTVFKMTDGGRRTDSKGSTVNIVFILI